jgi:hypothetical protein
MNIINFKVIAILTLITISGFCITPTKVVEKPVVIEILCEEDTYIEEKENIFNLIDKYCAKYNVCNAVVYQIGLNESGWPNPNNLEYTQKVWDCGAFSYGDMQIWEPTRKSMFKKLNLSDTTRENCLHASIYYLHLKYVKYGSWYKARFAYGRGSWRPENTWKPIEKRFMNKHNWKQYD